MARSADLSSFAATEVASHGFFIEIAVRLAAAQRLPGRITLRATPRHSAVTAQHGRAKTPHRVLCREKGSIHVRGPWPLGVLPRRAFGTDTRVCPPCRHGKEKLGRGSEAEEIYLRFRLDTTRAVLHFLDDLLEQGTETGSRAPAKRASRT